MKIDKKLNLIIPIDDDSGLVSYVFAEPIGMQIFERYFRVITATFDDIMTDAGGMTAGPRTAMLFLRDNAAKMGVTDDVENGLINEIRRLTNIVTPTATGWEHVPFQEAVNRKVLGEEDKSEVENALAFFTVGSVMFHRRQRAAMLTGAVVLWSGQTTYSSITEFVSSLKTSTTVENTGEKETPSFMPR